MQSDFVTIQTAFYEITGAGGEGAIQVREFISFHMLAKPPLRSEREDAYPKTKW